MGRAEDDLQRKIFREARLQPERDLSAIIDWLHSSLCEAYEEYDKDCLSKNIEGQRLGICKVLESFSQAAKYLGFSETLCEPLIRVERALTCINTGITDELMKLEPKPGRPKLDYKDALLNGIIAAIAELFWLDAKNKSSRPNLNVVMRQAAIEISKSPRLKKINGKDLGKLRERIRGYKEPVDMQKVERITYDEIISKNSNKPGLLEIAKNLIFKAAIPHI
jgi:hypothetical protein